MVEGLLKLVDLRTSGLEDAILKNVEGMQIGGYGWHLGDTPWYPMPMMSLKFSPKGRST